MRILLDTGFPQVAAIRAEVHDLGRGPSQDPNPIARGLVPWWLAGLLARDLTVPLIALYALYRREWASFQKMAGGVSGKLASARQFLFFATVVLAPLFSNSVFVVAVLFSLLAAFDYGRRFVVALRQRAAAR